MSLTCGRAGRSVTRAALVLTVLVVGCGGGSSEDEVARLALQQRESARQMADGLDRIAVSLDAVVREISALRADVATLGTSAKPPEAEPRGEETSEPTAGGTATTSAGEGPESTAASEATYLTLLSEIQALRVQLGSLQSGIEAIRTDAAQREERARLRDPMEVWTAMGEPEQLAKRLDRLSETFAPQIEDLALRERFKTDVATFRDSLTSLGTIEQRAERQRQRLREQLASTTNAQMRQWIEQQIASLTNATSETLTSQVENYEREGNSRELRGLIGKYRISRRVLQDVGLPDWGARAGP